MLTERNLIKYSGFIYFGFMLIFSIVFAYERIIHSDAAFYLFKLIHFENFNIEHGRYSAFISQLFILPFIKMGFSLKSLIYIYSASFIFLFYLVFLILLHGFKQERLALVLMLVLITGLSHPMYRPVSESTQGLSYSILLAGLLWSHDPRITKISRLLPRYFLAIAIILLCFFSHPLTIFSMVFILLFYMVDQGEMKRAFPWVLLLFIVTIFAVKSLGGSSSGYEQEKIMELTELRNRLSNFGDIYSTRFFRNKAGNTYLIPLILLLSMNIHYAWKKNWLKLGLLDASCVLFFMVHNIIYTGGADIELEKNYMTLNFFILLAFVTDLFPEVRGKLRKGLLLTIILFFSAHIILKDKNTYIERIEYYHYLNEQLQAQEHSKFYTTEDQVEEETILYMWGVPFETLLYSSLEGPEFSKTLYPFEESSALPEYIDDPDLFLCVFFWPKWNVNDLNEDYFRLPEQKYRYLELE